MKCRVVLVAGHDQGGCGHRGEAGGVEERHQLGHRSVEDVAAPARCGQQHARLDPGLGQVHYFAGVGVGAAGAQQEGGGVAAEGVPGNRDLVRLTEAVGVAVGGCE